MANNEIVDLLDIKVVPEFLNKLLVFKDQHLYIHEVPRSTVNEIVSFTQKFPKRNATVSVLTSKNSLIYLLGVNKCNEACQKDIADIVKHINPQAIFLELCANRACGCQEHKNNAFHKSKKLSYHHLQNMITQIGFLPAFLYYANSYREKYTQENIWLDCQEYLIKSLLEVKKCTNCEIILGDRPIDETLKREVKQLKYWDKAKLVSYITLGLLLKPLRKQLILSATNNLMKNEKNKNILNLERQIYLTYSLQVTARKPEEEKYKVIAIVSEAHVKGIQALWGKVTADVMNEMLHSEP